MGNIRDEWFPIASSADLQPGTCSALTLLENRLLLGVGKDGQPSLFPDTCPHRGAQLSLGSFDGAKFQCPYHGWEFGLDGRCLHQPAHPGRDPSAASTLPSYLLREGYGLLWACLGDNPKCLPTYPEYEDGTGRSLVLKAAPFASSGPRIIENFLDLAHFPFVHEGYLGDPRIAGIDRYVVEVVDGMLRLSEVSVWQPNPGPLATSGGPVSYEYTVSHPYAATLAKTPSEVDGGERSGFSILLVASPVNETECLVWRVVTVRDPGVDTDAQRAFNRTIFEQDINVVESQLPKRLPLDLRAEVHQPADAGSLAYRKWLIDRGTSYGTVPKTE
ncbi:MAG: aromatic ring-hydroxylating dioxygenase subunit alpha [Acidimicrobiales bacterium]|nr:aromatic ring-hydroxylating dioxygenase subunit alpha [Acidimicrobiales bacterium]